MADRIIPLNCPACSSPSNEGLREHTFGGEIKCKHCSVTSVLIIDNQWHQKKLGEYVCSNCGRIVRDGDRFCECSKALFRSCARCPTEFFIGKNVCPKCGWNHNSDLANDATQIALVTASRGQTYSCNIQSREFQMLCDSIAICPRLTDEADEFLREIVARDIQRQQSGVWSGVWSCDPWSGVYSGWLFSEKKLSNIATWLQRWRSSLLKLESDIEATRQRLAGIGSGEIVDVEGTAAVVGFVAGIIHLVYKLKNGSIHNLESLVGGLVGSILGACGVWIGGSLIAGIVLHIFSMLGGSSSEQKKKELENEINALTKKLELAKVQRPA